MVKGTYVVSYTDLRLMQEKSKMRFQEFGSKELQTVLLLQPMGLGPDAFDLVIPILSQSYHLIIPTIPGLDPRDPGQDFTSIEEIAANIEDWVCEHGGSHVKGIYGCSMGGAIAIRLMSDRRISAGVWIIDGGITPYQIWKPLTYIIGIRDFLMIWIAKHMSIKPLREVMNPDKYTEKDIVYVKDCLRGMSNRTIWRGFYQTNNYKVALPIRKPAGKVFYWYGEEEKKDRSWDLAYIRKNLPWAKIQENARMGHGESFTLFPDRFCQMLVACLQTDD